MAELLYTIGVNLLAAAVVVIAVVLFGQLRLALRQEQDSAVWAMIYKLVQAAEQQFGDPAERLEWVMEWAQRTFPRLEPALLRALVEAAVYEVNLEQPHIMQVEASEPDGSTAFWSSN